MMPQQNVQISKLLWLILSFVFFMGCKKNISGEITDMRHIPVYTKFSIPQNIIVDTGLNTIVRNEIQNKLVEQYPDVNDLHLLHSQKFHNTIDYFEYSGHVNGENIIFFAFQKKNEIMVKRLKVDIMPEKESRYKLTNDGLEIYKKFIDKRNAITLCVIYAAESNLISLQHDDGYSDWQSR